MVRRARSVSPVVRAAQKLAREHKLEQRARLIGAGIEQPKATRKNKFNSVRTTYGGERYDSLGEAEYAHRLAQMKLAGTIKDWGRPKPHILIDGAKARDRITYQADFWVIPLVGPLFYIDYKGSRITETAAWRLKVKLWRLNISDELRVCYPDGTFKIVAPAHLVA